MEINQLISVRAQARWHDSVFVCYPQFYRQGCGAYTIVTIDTRHSPAGQAQPEANSSVEERRGQKTTQHVAKRSDIPIDRLNYEDKYMEIVSTMTQFLAMLEGHHFATVALIAIVAVAKWHPPKG